MQNAEIILNELEEWLTTEKSAYSNGVMMSMAESIHGESRMDDVLAKLSSLKEKHTSSCDIDSMLQNAREWDEAMIKLYGRQIDVKMPTKTQILLIRACKVENHEQRLLSVYRRFYCSNEHAKFYVTGLLTDIVEQFIPMSTSKMIQKLNPRQYFTKIDPDMYFDRVFEVLVSHIANTACDEIPGYIAPAKWRNAK